ncbi:MAG TPA: tetratricopeptide repeat protein [Gammaproteobacteria bacterium]|nr:tetratricopeptide repeat protein [Gammaproteobacteria bacterium]
MIKLLLICMLALIGAVLLALLIKDNPGYVLIGVGPWSVETSLALLVFFLLLVFAALYLTIRFVVRLLAVPRSVGGWRKQRREQNAQKALSYGLIELAEGQWRQAERQVLKYAGQSEVPILNYLVAARAAQEQGAEDRRDHYLQLAHQNPAQADIAVGLTQVDLLLSQNQKEQALASLQRLYQLEPAHPQVLKPLGRLYRELGEWNNLIELLPKLRKRKIFDKQTLDAMAREAYTALLRDSAEVAGLMQIWSTVPKALREDETLLLTYLQRLRDFGRDAEGEPLLRNALKRHRNDGLLRMYGLIKGADPVRQLVQAELFLMGHEQDRTALLTAGRLCLRTGLWGKARSYLEASINAQPNAEALIELGTLLDKMGDRETALSCYREALRLAPCCEPPVAAEVDVVEHVPPAIEAPEATKPLDAVRA